MQIHGTGADMDGGAFINSRRKQVFFKDIVTDSFEDDLPWNDYAAPVMEEFTEVDELDSLLEEIVEPPDEVTQAEIDSTILLIRMKHPTEFGLKKHRPFRNSDGKRRGRPMGMLKSCLGTDVSSVTASFFAHHLTAIRRVDNCAKEPSTSDSLIEHQPPAKPFRRTSMPRVEELCFVPDIADGLTAPAKRRNSSAILDGCETLARAAGGFRLFTRTFSDKALAGCLRHPLFDTCPKRGTIPKHLRYIHVLRQIWLHLPDNERYEWQQLYELFVHTELAEFCRFNETQDDRCLETTPVTRQQLTDRLFVYSVDVDRLPCPLCELSAPKRFNIVQLHIHLNHVHHAVHVYACQFCSKGFFCQEQLKSHICEQFQDYYAAEDAVFTFNYTYVSLICAECGFHLILSPQCDEELFTSSFINCILTHNSESFIPVNVYVAAPLPAGHVRIGFHRLLPGGEFHCPHCPECVTIKTEEGERVELTTQSYNNVFDLDKHLRMSHKKEALAMKCARCPASFFNIDVYRDHILSHAQEVPTVTLFLDWAPVFPPLLERRSNYIRVKNQIDFDRYVPGCTKLYEPERGGEIRRSVRKRRRNTTLDDSAQIEDSKYNVKATTRRKQRTATWSNYRRMLATVGEIRDVSWLKSHTEFTLPVAFDGRTIVGNTVNGFVLNEDVFECKKCNSVCIGKAVIVDHLMHCYDGMTNDQLEADGIAEYAYCIFDTVARLPFGRIHCAHCTTTHCSIVALTKHCALTHSISLRLNKNDSVIQEAADDVLQKKWIRTLFDDYLAVEIENSTVSSTEPESSANQPTAEQNYEEAEGDDCVDYLNRDPSVVVERLSVASTVTRGGSVETIMEKSPSLESSNDPAPPSAEVLKDDTTVDGEAFVKAEVINSMLTSPARTGDDGEVLSAASVEKPSTSSPTKLTSFSARTTPSVIRPIAPPVEPLRPVTTLSGQQQSAVRSKSFISFTASGAMKRFPEQAGEVSRADTAAPKERDNLWCEHCSFATTSHALLMEHHKTTHSEGKEYGIPIDYQLYLCRSCCYAFIRLSEYERHMTSHSQPIACKKCSCVSGRDGEFLEHRQNHNSRSAIFACTACSIMYTREVMFMLHMVKHHDMRLAYFCKTCGVCNTNLASIFDHITYEPCRKLMTIDFIGFVDATQIQFLPSSIVVLNKAQKSLKMIELNKCRHNRCLNARAEPLVSCYKCNCLTTLRDFKNRSELSEDEIKNRVKFELAKDNNLLTLQCVLHEFSKPLAGSSSNGVKSEATKVQAIRSTAPTAASATASPKKARHDPTFEPAYGQLKLLNVAPTLANLRRKMKRIDAGALSTNTTAITGSNYNCEEDDGQQYVSESVSPVGEPLKEEDEERPNDSSVGQKVTLKKTAAALPLAKQKKPSTIVPLKPVKNEPPSEMDELAAEIPLADTCPISPLASMTDDVSDYDLEVVGVKLEKQRTIVRPRIVNEPSSSISYGLKTTRLTPLHAKHLYSPQRAAKTEPAANSLSSNERPIPLPQLPPVRPQLMARANVSSAPAGAPPAKCFMERFQNIAQSRNSRDGGGSPSKRRLPPGVGWLPDSTQPTSLYPNKPLPMPSIVATPRSIVHSIRLVPDNAKRPLNRLGNPRPYPTNPIMVAPLRYTPIRSSVATQALQWNNMLAEELDDASRPSSSKISPSVAVSRPKLRPPGGVEPPREGWIRRTRALLDDKEVVNNRLQYVRYHVHEDRFMCVSCMATHSKQVDAVLHQFREHNVKGIRYSLMCPICKSVFTDLTLFYAHMVTDKRHTKLIHRSEWCNFAFGSEEEAGQHNREHGNAANKLNMPCGVNCCGICGTVRDYWFERLDDRTFIDHTVYHGFRTSVVCRACFSRFDSDKLAFKHYTENHLQRDEANKTLMNRHDDVRRCKGCRRDVKEEMLFDHFDFYHKFLLMEFVPELDYELVISASNELRHRFHI